MIHVLRAALVLVVLTGAAAGAVQQPSSPVPAPQDPAPPAAPATQPPAGQTPPVTTPPVVPTPTPAPGCPAPVPPATAPARAFGSQTGILLYPVQSTRVEDFELFLRYLRDALARTTNTTVRRQASGWKFFRVAEPGPNGDVIYAFLLDPAVPCVDYALGPILSETYTDPAQLQEIWKLYTGAVRSGGTIMNLVPLPLLPAPPVLTPATRDPATVPGQTPAPGPSPPAPAGERP